MKETEFKGQKIIKNPPIQCKKIVLTVEILHFITSDLSFRLKREKNSLQVVTRWLKKFEEESRIR